jgi:hypothetical protein
MTTKRSSERRDGYLSAVRPSEDDRDDDDADVLKAAEVVLTAHEQCLNMRMRRRNAHGLPPAVEQNGYAQLREVREDALRNLMATKARGRRGLSAKKLVLTILVTWLGSEDPNCGHAMALLDDYERVMSEGKNGSDPVLAALTANWIDKDAASLPEPR